ncbi:hypothetical protein, partial [Nocardia tengchongensis]|uniref:hypothetical protein n=1 Tax=Nocardia tengchongensis TaxID=2055889 RepID=UPI0036B372A6
SSSSATQFRARIDVCSLLVKAFWCLGRINAGRRAAVAVLENAPGGTGSMVADGEIEWAGVNVG